MVFFITLFFLSFHLFQLITDEVFQQVFCEIEPFFIHSDLFNASSKERFQCLTA